MGLVRGHIGPWAHWCVVGTVTRGHNHTFSSRIFNARFNGIVDKVTRGHNIRMHKGTRAHKRTPHGHVIKPEP